MPSKQAEEQHSKRDWHGSHLDWTFSPRAFRWSGECIYGVNFLPIATELRAWMLQEGHLSLSPPKQVPENGGFYNPYTNSAVTLSLLMSKVINEALDYAHEVDPTCDEIETEIERIRLYNEILLYSARICEVAIKQLLFCTEFPQKLYGRMALGQLLESPCPTCKPSKGLKGHPVSMVGSLAHPYHLCLEFEHCAMDHMNLVNKLRNSEVAHSDIQELNIRTSELSRLQLKEETTDILSDFAHMLSHVEKLEQCIFQDLVTKGEYINQLKFNGLKAEDCIFRLVPGEELVYESSNK
ncbi:hypothetical protein ACRTEU_24100 [Vibrio alginolyticus]|uniref:hypothetical protein n=1 Tax=Vibrio alginolyticus TaxID=663 RepID=UPI003C12CD1B|nr:hypothetical protein [Vibrio parahaemolyticus]